MRSARLGPLFENRPRTHVSHCNICGKIRAPGKVLAIPCSESQSWPFTNAHTEILACGEHFGPTGYWIFQEPLFFHKCYNEKCSTWANSQKVLKSIHFHCNICGKIRAPEKIQYPVGPKSCTQIGPKSKTKASTGENEVLSYCLSRDPS